MGFDLRTLMFLFSYTSLITTGAMAFVYFNVRKRIRGIGFLVIALALQTTGYFILYEDYSSVFPIASLVAVFFVLLGNALFTEGFVHYLGRRFFTLQNYLILLGAMAAFFYFSGVRGDPFAGDLIFSAVSGFYALQGGFLFLVDTNTRKHQTARITGWVLLLVFALCVGRLFTGYFASLVPGDVVWAQTLQVLNLLVYFGLAVCLIFSIIVMINNRLFEEAKAQEEKFMTAFHSSPYAIILTRMSDGAIIEVNEGFELISGYTSEEVVNASTLSINFWVNDEDRDSIVKMIAKAEKIHNIELDIRRKSGEIISGLFSADLITIHDERYLLSTFSDTTELSRIKAELEQRATHDSLTGLPNRDLLLSHYRITKAFADRYKKQFAILSIDIDHFKYINDTYGHDIGDDLLIFAARKLVSTLRKGDLVCRFGGDEFIVLLCEIGDREAAAIVAGKTLTAFREPFVMKGIGEHRISLSIGIAMYPADGTDIQELLKNADLAMYDAKAKGRDRFEMIHNKS